MNKNILKGYYFFLSNTLFLYIEISLIKNAKEKKS